MISTAFILAAGFGIRMRPWTDLHPKPMLTLGKTPLILWHLEYLFQCGVRHFLVNTHHLSQPLQGFLRFHFESFSERGAHLTLLEEKEILGTGGALFQAKEYIPEENFYLINSDILHQIDLKKAASFHESQLAFSTLVLKRTEDSLWKQVAVQKNGQLSVLGKNSFTQKNPQEKTHGFTGIHVLNRKIFSYCPEKKYACIVNDLYPQAIKNGEKIFGFETCNYWKDIGSLKEFAEAHRDILKGLIQNIG
jgi:NDP-sugar pyrophosphorylase family protein